MKLVATLLLLALVQLTLSGLFVPSPPAPSAFGPRSAVPRKAPLSPSEVGNRVDDFVRGKYWYYLPSAHLCYLAHIDSDSGFLFLHLYKNHVGTFLAVSNYLVGSGKTTVNTFVRLGEGYEVEEERFAPISVAPFVISVDLGDGEYLVPHDDSASVDTFTFSETWARSKAFKSKKQQDDVHNKCGLVEKYLRKNYWYYLPDAITLDSSESSGIKNCYCVFHFVNTVGLWEAIARWDYSTNSPQVNTFVRLGDGYDSKKVEKCNILPAVTDSWSF